MFPLFVTGTMSFMTFVTAVYFSYQARVERKWQLAVAGAVMALTSISALHLLYQRIQYG